MLNITLAYLMLLTSVETVATPVPQEEWLIRVSDDWVYSPPDLQKRGTGIVAVVIANAGEQITANAKGDAANQPTAVELQLLQGTWEGVTVGDPSYQRITITITGNSLHFHRDTNFWFETTITLRPGTEPRQLHATIMDSASGQEDSVGKAVVAIYQIEDGKLTLAALGDGDAETTKSFEAAQDKGLTLYELRKVQPQEKKNTEPPKPQ
jgi:uncharacterized protein (TIGR03067 family)